MPKGILKLQAFHGGLSNHSDKRDIPIEEFVKFDGCSPAKLGALTVLGGASNTDWLDDITGQSTYTGNLIIPLNHDVINAELGPADYSGVDIDDLVLGRNYLVYVNKSGSIYISRLDTDDAAVLGKWGSLIDLGAGSPHETFSTRQYGWFVVDGIFCLSGANTGTYTFYNRTKGLYKGNILRKWHIQKDALNLHRPSPKRIWFDPAGNEFGGGHSLPKNKYYISGSSGALVNTVWKGLDWNESTAWPNYPFETGINPPYTYSDYVVKWNLNYLVQFILSNGTDGPTPRAETGKAHLYHTNPEHFYNYYGEVQRTFHAAEGTVALQEHPVNIMIGTTYENQEMVRNPYVFPVNAGAIESSLGPKIIDLTTSVNEETKQWGDLGSTNTTVGVTVITQTDFYNTITSSWETMDVESIDPYIHHKDHDADRNWQIKYVPGGWSWDKWAEGPGDKEPGTKRTYPRLICSYIYPGGCEGPVHAGWVTDRLQNNHISLRGNKPYPWTGAGGHEKNDQGDYGIAKIPTVNMQLEGKVVMSTKLGRREEDDTLNSHSYRAYDFTSNLPSIFGISTPFSGNLHDHAAYASGSAQGGGDIRPIGLAVYVHGLGSLSEGGPYFLYELDWEKGLKQFDQIDYTPWKDGSDDGDVTAAKKPSWCPYKFVWLDLPHPPTGDTYFTRNGYFSDQIGNIKNFKTACVCNRSLYIGNVSMKDGAVHGDKMMKSPPNRFLGVNEGNTIDVSINDGDEITHLEAFGDRILQFKRDILFIINASQGNEFLEATHKYRGVAHSSSVVRSDLGVIWINSLGAFLYNGKEITNLLEKGNRRLISESDWKSDIKFSAGHIPVVGFDPVTKDLIVTNAKYGRVSYIFNFIVGAWTRITGSDKERMANNKKTNILTVNKSHSPLVIYGRQQGTTIKFDSIDLRPKTGKIDLKTKDIDFGEPNQRKKIYKIYITLKGKPGYMQIKYYVDGLTQSTEKFNPGYVESGPPGLVGKTLYAGSQGTSHASFSKQNSGNIPFSSDHNTNFTQQAVISFTPKERDKVRNCKSFQLRLHSAASKPTGADFEINDITIIYRNKSVK